MLIEPRGTQRLSSQTLLDVRVSRAFRLGDLGRVELRLDVLNALNDTAEESIRTDVYNAAASRSGQYLHRPAPRDGQRQAQPGPVSLQVLAALFPRTRPAPDDVNDATLV